MTEPGASLDDLRRDLARLVRELLEVTRDPAEAALAPLVRDHLGPDARSLPILGDHHPEFDLPNVQLALDALLARPEWDATLLGVSGPGKRYSMLGLSDLLMNDHWAVGPPEYTNAPVGPGETLACLTFSVLLLRGPDGPVAVFVMLNTGNGPGTAGVMIEAAAPAEGAAEHALAEIRALMQELDVFRGKVITVEASAMTGERSVTFVERPDIDPDEIVLPDGVMDRIERHIVGPTRHRDALIAAGRHLGRGLLLWGPPGTGKTLTVRYLTGRLTEATIIILTGSALGMTGAFGTLARRLAPSVIVLEDVDLVAEEREYGPFGHSSPVLFELMNEMSGQGPDADVAFVLTTNRPDALEPALAARPGRVDLAVEIPLPDADARRRLMALYARGIDLHLDDPEAIVDRTEGVTASFIKELLRKAVLHASERDSRRVTQEAVQAALDELLHEASALTRVLLGSEAPSRRTGEPGHEWLTRFPIEDDGG